jgi:opacity protein-like surface antigen
MKTKVFTIASTLAILASSAAFAVTEGSYVGLNLVQSQVTSKLNQPVVTKNYKFANKYSVGASYKYAFNNDCMFIAPGVFYNHNNAIEKSGGLKEGVKYNFGARADIGYDVNEKMSAYGVVGLGRIRYASVGLGTVTKSKVLNRNTLILGGGVKLAAADNMDFSVEYTTQKFNLSNKRSSDIAALKFGNRLNVVQLGVAYKF